MRQMNASDFKARCLAVLDEVAASGEHVVILKRGRPVAELVPFTSKTGRFPQDGLSGTGEILDDIVAPSVAADQWNAVRGEL